MMMLYLDITQIDVYAIEWKKRLQMSMFIIIPFM